MPQIRITAVRWLFEYLVANFVDDYYLREQKEFNRSRAYVRKEIMAELEPHVKAIHEILSKPRLNIYE